MKIGIITMFYNSTNYGGILQAYSLIRALNKLGFDAEQICYNHYSALKTKTRIKQEILKAIPVIKHPTYISEAIAIQRRKKIVIQAANRLVPHSSTVYSEHSIINCASKYDVFITGSDQVWHGEWPAYFLGFVPEGKKRIAYAVSTGKALLSRTELEHIRSCVKGYYAVSVREKGTLTQMRSCIKDKEIDLVLDPTLLLEESDWEGIISERLISDEYLFCYFLGSDKRLRTLATQYANNHDLKVVTIPHMQGRVEKSDVGFGDHCLFSITPQLFLNLIKHSNMVFTDSFHALVFSLMFKKQFVVFGRTTSVGMNNRIESLLDVMRINKKIICEEYDFAPDIIESQGKVDYSSENEDYKKLKKESLEFLVNSLKQ